jgi:hypothetical protein
MPTAQCWRWVYKRQTVTVQAITMCVHSQTALGHNTSEAAGARRTAFSVRHVHRHDSKCTARVSMVTDDSCVFMNTLYFPRSLARTAFT